MAQTLLGNVKGPKGDTGAQGPQGEQGPTGAQGPQGETGPANTAFITDAFSTSQAYNAGDYCIYNNTLYRFAEDKAAGEWDDSKVMSTLIGTELSGLNSRANWKIVSINKELLLESSPTEKSDTGLSVDIPANSFFCITAYALYSNSQASWVGIGFDSLASCLANSNTGVNHASCSRCGYTDTSQTFRIWGQWQSTALNQIQVSGFYIMHES